MSHHIVTVCVVCVLCAAHVPCSAHTNLSAMTSGNSTGTKNHSDPDNQGQPFWQPMPKAKDIHPYSKDQQSPNNFTSNKHDAVRSQIMRHIDNNNNNSTLVTTDATSTASHDIYRKEMTESFKGGGSPQNTRPSLRNADVNSRDAELLERLAQTELVPGVNQKSAQSSEDLRTVNRSRLKRDVNERYFMQKIFEAYGDGTSITMDGFEKLIRKLGLLRLLTDASSVNDDGTDRSTYKTKS